MSGDGKTLHSGLLPVKLNTGLDKRELDRADFFVMTLGRCWRGRAPFELHVVALNNEIDPVRERITATASANPNLRVIFHQESEFFDENSDFYRTAGTYKQQMIKIFAPPVLGLGPFMTFDADVVCIRPFDEHTFVHNGKLISRWEHRHYHSWWENSMTATGIWTDPTPQGLSVTPNVLHSDLCALVSRYFSFRNRVALSELHAFSVNHPYLKTYESEAGHALTWSEYSLYTIVAEWFGVLYNYHLTADQVTAQAVQLHSNRSVWGGQSVGRLSENKHDPGYFAIVQSWAGIPIEEIAQRLKIPLP